MSSLISYVAVVSTLVVYVSCQYDGRSYSGYGPPVAILMHKQALGTDGSFNYAFSADNGLQQGESINPDGSRTGSYSYVDPSGKTITLRYTAGKDGFRVIEGDHVPRPPPLPVVPAANYYSPHSDAAYRSGPSYESSSYKSTGPSYESAYRSSSSPYTSSYSSYKRPSFDESEDRSGFFNQFSSPYSYGFDDEPASYTGPHSFGNGFSFEFGG